MLRGNSSSNGLSITTWIVLGVLILSMAISTPLAGSVHSSRAQGTGMNTSYLSDGLSTINLYNGNLSLAIPLLAYPASAGLNYGLTLVYNSNVWDWNNALPDSNGVVPPPDPYVYDNSLGIPIATNICVGCDTHNAGAGWRVSFGAFWPRSDPPINDNDQYLLIESDGTRRLFYQTLHEGETFKCDLGTANETCEKGWYYTRDGSYLRAYIEQSSSDNLTAATVESSDGTKRIFDGTGRLTQVADVYANGFTVGYNDYNLVNGVDDGEASWTITDTEDRVTKLYFNPQSGLASRQLEKVERPAFNGDTTTITFSYSEPGVRNPKSAGACLASMFPVLDSVDFDGLGTYSFEYLDNNCNPAVLDNTNGMLNSVTLPTGGRYDFEYGSWRASNCGGSVNLQVTEGVSEKLIYDAGSSLLGSWKIYHDGDGVLTTATGSGGLGFPASQANELRTLVESPSGDQTMYYLAAEEAVLTGPTCPALTEWYNGLPFSPDREDGTSDRFLGTAIYDGAVDPANLATNRLRETFVRYNADFSADATYGNTRLIESRTYYDDDGGSQTQATFSDFDGLGHFRTQTASGTVEVASSKVITVGFDATTSTYGYDIQTGMGSTTIIMPAATLTDPWIINTFDERTTTEGSSSKQQFQFNDKGQIERTRLYRIGSPQQDDVVERRVYGVKGNLIDQYFFGGDGGNLSINPDLSTLSLLTSNASFGLHHVFSNGVLATSNYLNNTTSVGFFLVNRTIDADTGLVDFAKDITGTKTTAFDYDKLNRVLSADPADDAKTVYTYTTTSVDIQEKVGTTVLARRGFDLDDFGRVDTEATFIPDSSGTPTYRGRKTCYDVQGRVKYQGELSGQQNCPTSGTPGGWTTFDEFDPFGRPGAIYPPDGVSHRIDLTYTGIHEVTRKVRLGASGNSCSGTSPADEDCVDITETYDSFARLVRVEDNAAGPRSRYSYDELDRLKEVTLDGNTTISTDDQVRKFQYDGRGFITCEQHPEKGTSGNGWTRYEHDALGNVTRRFEVNGTTSCGTTSLGFDLSFVYDKASRLMTIEDSNQQVQKSYNYSTVADESLGKLISAVRHNRVDLGNGVQDIMVTEAYSYGTTGEARVSQRTTAVGTPFNREWTQSFGYSPLGLINSEGFPCASSGATCTDGPLTLGRTYNYGFLTRVDDGTTDWVSDIGYHPNGMLSKIDYPGSLVKSYVQGLDPNDMQRPSSFGEEAGLTVAVSYDGSGNIKKLDYGSGTEVIGYDKQSRIVSFNHPLGSVPLTRDYAHDLFGNLQSFTVDSTTTSNSVTTTSGLLNRQAASSLYDAYGNLTRSPAGLQLEWDILGSLTKTVFTGDQYIYTADEERIGIVPVSGDATWRLRDLGGLVVREDRPTMAVGIDTIFADGFESGDVFCWSSGTPVGTYQDCTTESSYYLHEAGYHLITEAPDGSKTFNLPDLLGTPRRVYNEAGSIIHSPYAAPFGISESEALEQVQPFLYTGHERDWNSGSGSDDLDYMHMRTYWPQYGRFTSPDPVGGRVALPQSWNRNAYVVGNPMSLVDPYGLDFDDPITVTGSFIPLPFITQNIGTPAGIGTFGPDFREEGYLAERYAKWSRIEAFILQISHTDFGIPPITNCGSETPDVPPGVDLGRNFRVMRSRASAVGNSGRVAMWGALARASRTGGRFDYKNQGQGQQYEQGGNYAFGVHGAALFIPRSLIIRGGGALRVLSGDAKARQLFSFPFGDNDPRDPRAVAWGYDCAK